MRLDRDKPRREIMVGLDDSTTPYDFRRLMNEPAVDTCHSRIVIRKVTRQIAKCSPLASTEFNSSQRAVW